jgi:hypothetical protein
VHRQPLEEVFEGVDEGRQQARGEPGGDADDERED